MKKVLLKEYTGALPEIDNPPLPNLGEFYYGEELTDLRELLRLIGY
ncbi:MAG: hypothetical protein HFH60_01850 [Lachnospiraceae bacterium]|nr:hypothetical protein [Lachnospiraceae bacterium]